MDLSQFATTAGALPLIIGIVEVFKRAAGWSDANTARFAPLVSLVLGIVIVTAVTVIVGPKGEPVTTQELWLLGILSGALSGLGAIGLYDLGAGAGIKAVVGPANGTDPAG
jgi:uncharacterized membrane protein